MASIKGTILLTGANGGLGSATVSQIVTSPQLSQHYHGLYMVRDTDNASALDAATTGNSLLRHSHEKIALDLSQLSSVRKVAAHVNAQVAAGTIPRICAIILNAGYEEFGTQTWTSDGLDTTFATNYLGHWLLTLLLLQSMDLEVGRVVWISSWAHNPHDPRNSWNGSFKESRYNTVFNSESIDSIARGIWSANKDDSSGWAAGYRRYGASKLCGVTTIFELQRRLDLDPRLQNISVLGIDPGLVNTGIVRRSNWFMRVLLWQWLLPTIAWAVLRFFPNGPFRSKKKSAGDIIAAAVGNGPPPLCSRPKGLYLNGSALGVRNPEARDPAKAAMVWQDTVRYTKLEKGETSLIYWH